MSQYKYLQHKQECSEFCQSHLSTHIAMPIPPPTQRAATPFLPFVLSKACNNVTSILAPEAPMGWPKAIAPPKTLTYKT